MREEEEKNKKVGGEGLRKREAGESELLPENLCELRQRGNKAPRHPLRRIFFVHCFGHVT
jgi:hypothetical protein